MTCGPLKSLSDDEVSKLGALSAVSKALSSSYELELVLWSVVEATMQVLGADRGLVKLLPAEPFQAAKLP